MATKTWSFAGVILWGVALAWTMQAHGQQFPALAVGGAASPVDTPLQGVPLPQPAVTALHIQPDVEIKQASQQRTARGELELLIEVRNVGAIPVGDLMLRATLPPGVALLEAKPAPERLRSVVSWPLGGLGAGEHRALRLLLQDGGEAQVKALPFSVSFGISTTPAGGVSVPRGRVTVHGPPTAVVGVPLTLQIGVSNPGTVFLRQAKLRMLLPSGLSHAAGSDLESEVNNLGAGQTLNIPLVVTPTREGKMTVKLRLTPAGGEGIEIDHTVEVRQALLSLSANGPTISHVGEVCPCSFDVGNNGPEVAATARLVAQLPDGVSFLQASDAATYDPATHSVVWNLAELPPGKPRRLVLQGVSRQLGVQEYHVVLSAGQDRVKQASWTTEVTPLPTLGRTRD